MRLIDADVLFKDICDSINEMTKIGIMVDGEWLWAKLNDALENAPTIEPKKMNQINEETCQKTFCKNCKAYIRNCEDFFDILAGAPSISAEKIGSQPREPKWIPINSECPPRSGKYLVTRHEYDYGSRYSSVELMAWDSRVGWLDKKRGEGVIAWWSERMPNPFNPF